MKMGLLSFNDPSDSRSWSGSRYNLLKKLKMTYDVEWIVPAGLHGLRHKINKRFGHGSLQKRLDFLYFKCANIAYRLRGMHLVELLHRDYAWYYSTAFAEDISRSIEKEINKSRYDILFAPHAIAEIAFLNSNIPIISLNDCTFAGMVGYYPHLSSLTQRNIREGNIVERNAIQKSAQIIYSSSWAINTAADYYGADPKKLNLIHFGSNLAMAPGRRDLKSELGSTVRLLFVGVDWARKGGDIALETLNCLSKSGVPSELTIIGCDPEVNQENVRIMPYLDKKSDHDLKILQNIFMESDFFIMPTRAECSAIVFCEASAFGLPIISTDTGGVADYVVNNFNGYRLPLSARGSEYAEVILKIVLDPNKYLDMRRAARAKYEKELNWDVWLEKFNAVVAKI
jgi:glycosyltransferase involved in cell wall biosynthesis